MEEEIVQPLSVRIMLCILKCWFFVFDILAYIPFQVFANPQDKLERSRRIKSRPINESDPGSPWRNSGYFDGLITQKFEGCDTLDKHWDRATMTYGNCPCMGTREILSVEQQVQPNGRVFEKYNMGRYNWRTFSEVAESVFHIGSGLMSVGHKPRDCVVIFAETRADWTTTALACLKYGFPVTTVYATLGEDAIAHALNESQSPTIITTQELVPKVMKIVPFCEQLRRIVYFHSLSPEAEEVSIEESQLSRPNRGRLAVFSFTELLETGKREALESEVKPVPSDLALIMYTSGTTGLPKGVMITHSNLVAALAGEISSVPKLGFGDIYIGYLPLAHILEVAVEFCCLFNGVAVGYSSPLTLTDQSNKIKKGSKGDASVLKPTLMACVPAIMDRLYKAVMEKVMRSSPLSQAFFYCVYERKRAKFEEGYDNPFLNRMVFSRIRSILGGRVRIMLSGGAPLHPETQRFMNICFCCPVGQGYGLTETCGAGTICDVGDLTVGHAGPPLPCNDIMLKDWEEGNYTTSNQPFPQGEILISGGNVVQGYMNDQEKTAEDFVDINGRRWFCTGDIGEFQPNGNLKIIDRKKDMVKLSHGEYVSLAKIETRILTCPLVDNVCAYGDSTYPYLVALIVPNKNALLELAEKVGEQADSLESACASEAVEAAALKEIRQHCQQNKLDKSEIPMKIHLCTEVWTPAMGILTEAYKLKRKPIEMKYKQVLDNLYSEKSKK